MPFNNEITIDPASIFNIMQMLKNLSWSGGPVIIRDLGTSFQVRDKDEQHIFSLVKNDLPDNIDIHDQPG